MNEGESVRSHLGDSSLIKSINKSHILQYIRQHAPISRAALAKQTKLSRATVSALVEELITDHLVIEIGVGQSSGGRKPMLLEMNRDAGYVFGIDLRATEIVFIVTNMYGESIDKIVFRYENEKDEQQTLQQVIKMIRLEKCKLPESPLGLCGIGLGVHGFVEFPSNRILFVPYFGWKGAEWKDILEDEFQVNVYIDNEANLAALGELEAGVTKEDARYSDLIYLSIGTGIGAGMILDGDIFRGNKGFAGEVGHTTIEFDGRPCPCGNRGCWEMYASEKALARQLDLAYKPGITQTIIQMLQQQQPRAQHALMSTGRSLAMGIGNLVHMFNPQLVVLGNQMGKYSEWLHPYIMKTMAARFSLVENEIVEIKYSQLGDEACALGAAHLTIRNILQL